MKTYYVKDLTSGQHVDGMIFGIANATKRSDKNNNPYYDIKLQDNSGMIKGKIWSDVIPAIPQELLNPGKVVRVTGEVGSYRDQLQFTVQEMSEATDMEYELSDLQNASKIKPKEAQKRVEGYLKKISDKELKKLVESFLNEYSDKYYLASAAKVNHHQFVGGLVEHTLEMLDIAWSIKDYYSNADYDIVTAAILLHDMGKVWELERQGFATMYSIPGKLVGHIVMVIEKLNQFVIENYTNYEEILDSKQYLLLKHAVLAHHGKMEYGSPVIPLTIEAEIVSKSDDLSWSTRAFERVSKENPITSGEGDKMAPRDFALGRGIYLQEDKSKLPKMNLASDQDDSSSEDHQKKEEKTEQDTLL
jgi:3'-5' exoribonuclease